MAIASWGEPERVPFIAIPMGVALQRLNVPPPPPGTPGPLSRPTPEALGGLLEGGGFSEVEVEDIEVTFEWEPVLVSAETAVVRGKTDYADDSIYHNLWVVQLAPDGRASSFTEWWMEEPKGGEQDSE